MDEYIMTNTDLQHLSNSIEDIRHLLELQNGRVRSNETNVAVLKEWRTATDQRLQDILVEIKLVRQDLKGHMEKGQARGEQARQDIAELDKKLEKQISKINIQNAANQPILEWIKRNGVMLVILLFLMANEIFGILPTVIR